jgi:drug/metabolite transporter (DMT)-like permease
MRARLVWLILCCIWGSTWLFIKIGLKDLPPLTFAGIRFVIASAILIAIVAVRRLPFSDLITNWRLLALTGVLSFSFNYGFIFWGEQYISSGLAALLQATIPAFGLVFAHFYLPGEQITPRKVTGVVLGILGVGVVFSNQLTVGGEKSLAGCVAIVLSSIIVAYSNVLVKARGKHIDPVIMAAGQMLFGLIPLLVIGISLEGNPIYYRWTMRAVVSLFYLAIVGSVIAFVLYYWLVRKIDVTKSMLIALVTPVVAVIVGMIVLSERINWRTLLGGAMIISGIGFLVTLHRKKKPVIDLVSTTAL